MILAISQVRELIDRLGNYLDVVEKVRAYTPVPPDLIDRLREFQAAIADDHTVAKECVEIRERLKALVHDCTVGDHLEAAQSALGAAMLISQMLAQIEEAGTEDDPYPRALGALQKTTEEGNPC